MKNAADLLLADARTVLCKQVEELVGSSELLEACAAWALPKRREQWKLKTSPESAVEHLSKSGRTYRDVAQLGYALATTTYDSTAGSAFVGGVEWLVSRNVKSGENYVTFCFDSVAMLGIALGVRAVEDSKLKDLVSNWFCTFVPEVASRHSGPSWVRYILRSLPALVSESTGFVLPDAEDDVADVKLVLQRALTSDLTVDATLQDKALGRVKRTESEEAERAVFLLSALDVVSSLPITVDLKRPSIQQVAQLLARVPAALRKWTWEDAPKTRNSSALKWDVQNEYHVQNLLYALLAPIFTDLVDEEWMPPVGQRNPRIDIGIPSLNLIVEAKFLRPGVSFSSLIGELAEDASLYRAQGSGGRYQHILPFVWDDSRRTEEHAKFLQGLTQIEGIVHPVVVARPGQMSSSRRRRAAQKTGD